MSSAAAPTATTTTSLKAGTIGAITTHSSSKYKVGVKRETDSSRGGDSAGKGGDSAGEGGDSARERGGGLPAGIAADTAAADSADTGGGCSGGAHSADTDTPDGGDQKQLYQQPQAQAPVAGCYAALQGRCQAIILNHWFNIGILLCIVFNTAILMLNRYPEDPSTACFLDRANVAMTSIFATEMALKLLGLGLRRYRADTFNVFDAVVVIFSIAELVFAALNDDSGSGACSGSGSGSGSSSGSSSSSGGGGGGGSSGGGAVSALRSFRLFRVFKLASSKPRLRQLLETLANTIAQVGKVTGIRL